MMGGRPVTALPPELPDTKVGSWWLLEVRTEARKQERTSDTGKIQNRNIRNANEVSHGDEGLV